MKIYNGIEELVGATPLLLASRYSKKEGLSAELYLKLESFNPAGSVKDRAALSMIEAAEREGRLSPGGMIVEPTSGNTGIALAAIGSARGYRVKIVMPSTMSEERIKLMRAYGAEVILSDGALGMSGAIALAESICRENDGAMMAGQFTNPENTSAHIRTTAPEIWEALDGRVDIFVAGVGTGGTLTGIGTYLKERDPSIRVVAVEPKDSPLLSGGKAGPHPLQGIGANFIPKLLDPSLIDEVIAVAGDEAYGAARSLAASEGLLVGISSGAALYAAHLLSKREENRGKRIVALLPDGGEKYLSTELFSKA